MRAILRIEPPEIYSEKKLKESCLEGEGTQIEMWWSSVASLREGLLTFYCHYKKYEIGNLPSNLKICNCPPK